MSNTSKRTCYGCGTIFYANDFFGGTKCNVCTQTESINRQNSQQAELNRQHNDAINRQNAISAANQTRAIVEAEQERIAAINKQTEVMLEAFVTPSDAYNRGYTYVNNEFKTTNPVNVDIKIGESGGIIRSLNLAYYNSALQERFVRGLDDWLIEQDIDCQHELMNSAYLAGVALAEGANLEAFTMSADVALGGVNIKTRRYSNSVRYNMDNKTYEMQLIWNDPFNVSELNDAFKAGILHVQNDLNAYEHIQLRRANKRFGRLIKFFPYIACGLAWEATSGWDMICAFVAVYGMTKLLKWRYSYWQNFNYKYLYD